ncbi:MAG: hypothetical protein M1829_006486 [Trizodia sp. TS-e1964]|nr:MAG: hypothetical protein M1829_006486 [Trizodia sp. TS-e1964]
MDLSQVQSVQRVDLYPPISSSESSPFHGVLQSSLFSKLKENFAELFYDEQGIRSEENNIKDAATEATEGLLEFKLFSSESNAATGPRSGKAQMVRLCSPMPETSDPGFLAARPSIYFFAQPADSARAKEFESSALSGEDVRRLSKSPWNGCSLPWRVVHIPRAQAPSGPKAEASASGHTHLRLHKKRRIVHRLAILKKAQEAREFATATATQQAKRAKRNREKKLKRKAREKCRKEGVENVIGS